jgi:hypothetical protein
VLPFGGCPPFHNFFTKKIEAISIETVKLQQIKLDFGMIDPKGEINGLSEAMMKMNGFKTNP